MFKYFGVFLDQASFYYTQYPCCSQKGETPPRATIQLGIQDNQKKTTAGKKSSESSLSYFLKASKS